MQTQAEYAESLRLASVLHESAYLQGIRLNSLEAQVFDRKPDPPYSVVTELRPNVSLGAKSITFEVRYEVKALADEDEVFRIVCEFQAGYEHDLDDVTGDMASTYGDVIVLATLHPYVRELVHRVSSDLGFPGLFLDNLDSKDLFQLLSEEKIKKRNDEHGAV
ncbi:protein-export chaperone SecB [Streptomyces sp. NRRL F-5650]|uniref:protein-export chaperone SecB n=1 Tax=Streptomyces sp. NRRL F-5650 TaxID=1463868 RepID=UPI00099E0179|nr:protein-export chaperone SecB [Streptomyces sp. NRRL F-5650]